MAGSISYMYIVAVVAALLSLLYAAAIYILYSGAPITDRQLAALRTAGRVPAGGHSEHTASLLIITDDICINMYMYMCGIKSKDT